MIKLITDARLADLLADKYKRADVDEVVQALKAERERTAALEEERYALLYQNNKDAHRIAALEAELDAYDADYTLCDCCNCLTPDPIDCREHVQCKSCTKIAALEAEAKMLRFSLAAHTEKLTSTGAAQAAMTYEIELRERRIGALEAGVENLKAIIRGDGGTKKVNLDKREKDDE